MSSANMLREYFARDALRNIAPLKFIQKSPQDCVGHVIVDGDRSGAIVMIDNASSSFDREAYPNAAFSVFIDASHPAITGLLLDRLPQDRSVVFKLGADADEAVVRGKFAVTRATSFLSFTGTASGTFVRRADVTVDPDPATMRIFAEQGHPPSWIASALADKRGFVVERRIEGTLTAACFAIEIFAGIWEIGGVYTEHGSRRKGHARAVVETALAQLDRLDLTARYQVQETNAASIALARSLELRHHLTITHLVSRPHLG